MQFLKIIWVIGMLGAFGGFAQADQKDPRLDGLFTELKQAPDLSEAVSIERKIWTIWFESPDQSVRQLMETGVKGMHFGDLVGALKAFDEMIDIAPDFAEGWNKRATVHFLMRNFEQSLDDIVRTLELEPRHFGALSGRGLIYAELDDLERALVAFEEALEVYPQMHGPRINVQAIRRILKSRDI